MAVAGKIRVYVRVRPMSQSEMDRNAEEAVLKVELVISTGYTFFVNSSYISDDKSRFIIVCC